MQAHAVLAEAAPRISSFMGSYAAASPRAQASTGWQGEATALCLQEVVDIEESIWAPQHGLKGMVDASVVAAVQPLAQHQVGGQARRVCLMQQQWMNVYSAFLGLSSGVNVGCQGNVEACHTLRGDGLSSSQLISCSPVAGFHRHAVSSNEECMLMQMHN